MDSRLVDPIHDEALGNTSYLVAVDDSSAICVDPRRDADDLLRAAQQRGVEIIAVLETHLHADFVGGAREIADATGATIYAAAGAGLDFPHSPLEPGSSVQIGPSRVDVIPAPGHTPEHVAYLLGGRLLFTGGSLIAGGAARTDLSGPQRVEELTRAQYATINRLAAMPGETYLYPTHGAGSFCSAGAARSRAATIGEERKTNPWLAVAGEDVFVERFLQELGTFPPYFGHLREINRAGAPLLRSLPAVPELSPDAAAQAANLGAWIIDGRPHELWAATHPQGAVSIEVRPAFASWLGWVVPFGAPVVFVLDPAQTDAAFRLSRRIGYDRIAGWLTFESWRNAGLPTGHVETIDAAEALERTRDGALLLDVRQRGEYVVSHIAGAHHLELGDIIAGKRPEATDVITYCGHGERSATAAGLLAGEGVHVANLRGGSTGWRRAGLPFET
jgi:glyoxylase-like metal-dependent hydrolase (beta-lactamase superfamily II)